MSGGVNGHTALPYNSLCHCYKGVGKRSCNKSLGNPLQIVKVCGSKLAPKKRHPITWICSLDAWKKQKHTFPNGGVIVIYCVKKVTNHLKQIRASILVPLRL